jgi:hypothetical protein
LAYLNGKEILQGWSRGALTPEDRRLTTDVRINNGQASVPRDALSPTPPGPEGSNGNGLLRVQWVSGAWLFSPGLSPDFLLPHKIQHRGRKVRQVREDGRQVRRRDAEPIRQSRGVLIQ